jgi:hypothetical protein
VRSWPEVPNVWQTLEADDGQGDMMLNACRPLGGQEVVTCCLEELHGGTGLEGR